MPSLIAPASDFCLNRECVCFPPIQCLSLYILPSMPFLSHLSLSVCVSLSFGSSLLAFVFDAFPPREAANPNLDHVQKRVGAYQKNTKKLRTTFMFY